MKSLLFLLKRFAVLLVMLTIGLNVTLAQDITFTATENNLGIENGSSIFGCAWGDYDSDGDLDLFISDSPHYLYRNDGGQFVDVAEQMGVRDTVRNYPTGAAWADIDNDHDLDLLSINTGLRIFRNDDSTFTNISEEAGVVPIDDGIPLWQATCGDYDKDGDLDIAFAGGDQGVGGFDPPPARVLRNDDLAFTDVAEDVLGWQVIVESWSPVWVDYNNDRQLDLWLPAIRSPLEMSHLFQNDSGLFLLVTDVLGIQSDAGIASSWGDYDNDGDMDLFIITWTGGGTGQNDMLYRNDGDVFVDVAPDLGLDGPAEDARGLCWGDYDNDGDLDLVIGSRTGNQKLYRNDGTGTDREFVEVGEETGAGVEGLEYRNTVFVDYDNDGFLDLFFNSADKLLMHNEGNGNHWLGIKPRGTTSNRDGIGARVRVVTGDKSQIRDIEGGGMGGLRHGYLWAHFGLGSNTVADSVIVYWPMGTVDVATNVPADNYHTFEEGSGIVSEVENETEKHAVPSQFTLNQNYPNPFNSTTTISFHLARSSNIRLILLNITGDTVKELAAGEYSAGRHNIKFNAGNLPTGLYLYRLTVDGLRQTKKLMVIK